MSENGKSDHRKTFTEEVEVAGSKLVERAKELLAEGKVRRLRVKAADGEPILEIPVNVGAIAGGAVALAAPWLALIAAFAGLVAHARIEIIRDGPKAPDTTAGGGPGKLRAVWGARTVAA